MNEDLLSDFEAQARQVERKSLPPEWRSEILNAALPEGEGRTRAYRKPLEWLKAIVRPGWDVDRIPPPEQPATQLEVVPFTDARNAAGERGRLEGRIRKAERRATWSMAACLVVTLCLIALLFRPKSEPRALQSWMAEAPASQDRATDRDLAARAPEPSRRQAGPGLQPPVADHRSEAVAASNLTVRDPAPAGKTAIGTRGESRVWIDNDALASVPPPPPPPSTAGNGAPVDPGAGANQFEESSGGFLLREPAMNDIFQMQAVRQGRLAIRRKEGGAADSKKNETVPGEGMESELFLGQVNHIGKPDHATARPLDLPSGGDHEVVVEQIGTLVETPTRSTAKMSLRERPATEAGQAGTEGLAPKKEPAPIRRAPFVLPTTPINRAEVSNQVTEEVRYSVDTKDSGGQLPASREIGVMVAVTPSLLPDGTIRMKMRPRSAQTVEEVVSQSGKWYAGVSESMIEQVARVPEGHSVVLGGFYGQVKSRHDNEVPLLGDVPAINFYFKDKEAAKERPSLLFVATPTTVNDQIVVETKILEVGREPEVRTGVDWSASLGAAGLPVETIGSLNSLFGIENPGEADSETTTAAEGPIVLSPTQTEGVLRALASGGLVTQMSNPTLVTEDNEQATISLIDRVPIITTTINETGGEADPGIKSTQWSLPLHAWKKIQKGHSETEPEEVLRKSGVTFPEGALIEYSEATGTMVANNTTANLRRIDSLVRGALEQVEREREREREAQTEFETYAVDQPYSTFSLNVSDVSFKLAQAALARGEWPAPDQVRVEEFVNAFDYGDPAPSQNEKVACKLEQAVHPFFQQRNLLRVSMKTAALGRAADTPLRLTVLLDNSGSMERIDRREAVKTAFQLLANQLHPEDQVTLIGFARTPRLLADRVTGDRMAELAKVVESTTSEGGTNIEQALKLGLEKAKEQMLADGQNRIILLTDGAVNLGNARPGDLAKLVEEMRQQKIAFDACGVGADGLNDEVLESLTRKGDGRYYFLNRPEDADEGFARQIAGALRPAARNVKVQIKFNPDRVGRYKLYGFEKHRLQKEDFRNDHVDAAELAAEEAGNAIYQLELLPEGSGEIGTVSVRFQDAESGRIIEREWTIPYEAQVPRLENSAASLRLASGAALLGEKLKGSLIGDSVELVRLARLMHGLTGGFPSSQRVKEIVQMTDQARELLGE